MHLLQFLYVLWKIKILQFSTLSGQKLSSAPVVRFCYKISVAERSRILNSLNNGVTGLDHAFTIWSSFEKACCHANPRLYKLFDWRNLPNLDLQHILKFGMLIWVVTTEIAHWEQRRYILADHAEPLPQF